ncbi:hypothetical protein VIGAN_07040800 [Vigna angularis var. angularis]|uniref:Uncharacterized protein n=1 Tax=Vigna angularis var. angularis TaxID=157739 RepID=A0A0S3SG63_PHAAN|nr:hypothetical protein VIGAN_07040800 [Vigna angularis var. angularis]
MVLKFSFPTKRKSFADSNSSYSSGTIFAELLSHMLNLEVSQFTLHGASSPFCLLHSFIFEVVGVEFNANLLLGEVQNELQGSSEFHASFPSNGQNSGSSASTPAVSSRFSTEMLSSELPKFTAGKKIPVETEEGTVMSQLVESESHSESSSSRMSKESK